MLTRDNNYELLSIQFHHIDFCTKVLKTFLLLPVLVISPAILNVFDVLFLSALFFTVSNPVEVGGCFQDKKDLSKTPPTETLP